MMISNVNGEFRSFSGDIIFDEKKRELKKFTGSVDVSSIDTGIEKRDAHLKSPDFFNVKKHPKLLFSMKSYKKANKNGGELVGDLTINGVSKEVTFKVSIGGPVKNMQGETIYAFILDTEINRKDFGLTWNKALESGGVVVGDEVKITLELETAVL